jgi:hypothetical protein
LCFILRRLKEINTNFTINTLNYLNLNSFFFNLNYNFLKKLKKNFYFLDFILIFFFFLKKKDYIILKKLNFNFFSSLFSSFLLGLRYLYLSFSFWIVPLILSLFVFYFLIYSRLLPFSKVLFEWFLISMFLYWLFSGFVFFVKKYQFSKFTSVIQRFWKRSYILFWIIESGFFVTFFYLTLNASEEPVYMYDQMKLYKMHLFSWRLFIPKLVLLIILLIVGYYYLFTLKWSYFNKQSYILIVITLVLLYLFWLEFYQFFHIISFYSNLNWVFDYDEFIWNLELEFRRTRLANNYVTLCLLAKFWHLVFIFLFWVFFLLRSNEIGRVRYFFFSANLQNFLILYIMSWLYMYPWLKFCFRGFLDEGYFWFVFNFRSLGLRIFFNDLKLFFFSIFNNFNFTKNFNFENFSFFYFFESSNLTNYNQFKKHALRDFIINKLN